MSTKISQLLKEKRKQNNLSVKDVLSSLRQQGIEVSEKTLYGWESGHRQPDADTFLVLCQIYNVQSLSQLNDFECANESNKKESSVPSRLGTEDSRLQNIIDCYDAMNEEGKESLYQQASMHAENHRYKKAATTKKQKKTPPDIDALWESAGKTIFGGAAAFGGNSEQIEYTPEEYKRICELYDSISKK